MTKNTGLLKRSALVAVAVVMVVALALIFSRARQDPSSTIPDSARQIGQTARLDLESKENLDLTNNKANTGSFPLSGKFPERHREAMPVKVEPKYRLGYRQPDWILIEQSSEPVASLVKTLKNLQCDTRPAQHPHIGKYEYRCRQWTWKDISNKDRIEGWAGWLQRLKFESVMIGTATSSHTTPVRYRIKGPRKVVLLNPEDQLQITNTLRMLGCNITDVVSEQGSFRFSCPDWNVIFTSEHNQAHGWMNWLQESGFEVEHIHPPGDHGHTHGDLPVPQSQPTNPTNLDQ